MPQIFDAPVPFPERISPEFARVEAGQLDWPRGMGMIRSDRAAAKQLQGDLAQLGARLHPWATGPDLDLGVDQESWYFLFDDLFDGPRGRDPALARQLTQAVTDALSTPPCADSPPVVRGFADYWRRSCEGMTPAWRKRAAAHWSAYFHGYVVEASYRRRRVRCSAGECFEIRRHTVGVQPVLDLMERTGHFELPPGVFELGVLEEMRRIAKDVVILQNEIVSVEKEEAGGEDNNLVLIVQREAGCSRDESIRKVTAMLRGRIEDYLALEREFPETLRRCGAGTEELLAADRYRVDALRVVMRGCHDWHIRSGRYKPSYDFPADGLGYLEDIAVAQSADSPDLFEGAR